MSCNPQFAEDRYEDVDDDLDHGDGDGGDDYDSCTIDDGTYFYGGKAAWCEDHRVSVIDRSDGVTCVGVIGEGLISLDKFLKNYGASRLKAVN